MLTDVVLGCDFLQIVEKLLALAKVARPGISRTEGIGIGMVRRIDAAARIAVDVPGAPELVVLLDDGIGNAQATERDPKRNGTDPGSDDQDVMLRHSPLWWTLAPAGVARYKAHLLPHQRRIFRRDVLAQARAHHLENQLISGVGDDRLWIAMRKQFQDCGTDLMLDLRGHASVGIRDQADVALGLVWRLQPALVAGHVHQYHQQNADVA